jgi:hypothetical protein
MREVWPTAVLVHLPVHAFWLNQIEIYSSIVQRKIMNAANFADLTALEQRLLGFQGRYNATPQPFNWRYTKTELNNRLPRSAGHPRDTPPRGLTPEELTSRSASTRIGERRRSIVARQVGGCGRAEAHDSGCTCVFPKVDKQGREQNGQ